MPHHCNNYVFNHTQEDVYGDGPEIWQDDDMHLSSAENCDASFESSSDSAPDTKFIKVYLFFLFMFQTLFRLSDVALKVLLVFLRTFFELLAHGFNLPRLQAFATKLPRSIRAARKEVNSTRDDFQKFVCCPQCHNLYTYKQCIVHLPGNLEESKKCDYVKFPNHPCPQHRTPCGAVLMKKVKSSTGKIFLYPHLVYCYRSIITALQEMILRPHFMELCESWRQTVAEEGVFRDVYDGQVWKDFLRMDGKPFLELPYNFAFHLNIDWFQPFEHTQHSEGVIYLTIINLERKHRLLQENVLLVGVIPGPKEPRLDINAFLKPLVDDLLLLWTGVIMHTIDSFPVLVRAALLCAACDIPAARKTCGFVGHSAYRGCSKCLVVFPTSAFGEKPDYSNFNRSEWEPRTNDAHRAAALKYRDCNTKTQQKEIEREHGVRYSILLELLYFDAPRMCIVDPMHNLLLGTAKHNYGRHLEEIRSIREPAL